MVILIFLLSFSFCLYPLHHIFATAFLGGIRFPDGVLTLFLGGLLEDLFLFCILHLALRWRLGRFNLDGNLRWMPLVYLYEIDLIPAQGGVPPKPVRFGLRVQFYGSR